MSQSFAPPESSADLWLERSNFSGELLGGIAYGVHLCVFATAMYFTLKAPKKDKISICMMVAISALFSLATIMVGCNTKFNEIMWIDGRDIPGGPNAWLNLEYNMVEGLLGNSAFVASSFIADGILIYRLFVIWGNNYFLLMPSILTLIASTVLGALATFQAAAPGSTFWSHTTVILILPYWSLSVSLNILISLAIVVRLLTSRRSVTKTLGAEHAKMYTSISAMIVESAAINSVTGLILIICYARESNVQNLLLPVYDHAICIAPELIALRVALGRAWSRETSRTVTSSLVIRRNGFSSEAASKLSGNTTAFSRTLASQSNLSKASSCADIEKLNRDGGFPDTSSS
ncbi:hypothetical protein SCHPADRAFT_946726 [Schizopora paradoxa]|uniref:Uncharacterized protein n=1 Tax=Schizopora paradoxa TaxID=27342 RepID=A0A0H2R1N4_9AGAM|nr:hypothetical protein SCHPADRAFT_946726 [Schizopora paradoxa]